MPKHREALLPLQQDKLRRDDVRPVAPSASAAATSCDARLIMASLPNSDAYIAAVPAIAGTEFGSLRSACRNRPSAIYFCSAYFCSSLGGSFNTALSSQHQVERGRRSALRARRAGGVEVDHAHAERGSDMYDDIVLAFAEAREWLVEALRPDMRAALRRDQLAADPHRRAYLAHAAFEHIAHTELAANVADVAPCRGRRTRTLAIRRTHPQDARDQSLDLRQCRPRYTPVPDRRSCC